MSNPITKCHGCDEGETCYRDGCRGKIKRRKTESCSCHINPPCGSCTAPNAYCEKCDWQEADDAKAYMNGFEITQNKTGLISTYKRRELDKTKIDYHTKVHTNSSQLCEGVYPDGVTAEEIEKRVRGTFGGRFQQFGGGTFSYVAYTD